MTDDAGRKKAGFWIRVTALTLDEIVLILFTWGLLVALRQAIPLSFENSLLFKVLFYEFLDYNYYTLCWLLGGQTIGKRIMRTRVIKSDGSAITYKDAFVRYWTWMMGVALGGIGYFWIAWEKDKRGWNDLVAKTSVVRV